MASRSEKNPKSMKAEQPTNKPNIGQELGGPGDSSVGGVPLGEGRPSNVGEGGLHQPMGQGLGQRSSSGFGQGGVMERGTSSAMGGGGVGAGSGPVSEARGISALPEKLAGIGFPIAKDRLIEQYGTCAIDLPGGQTCELRQLVEGYDGDDFDSMGDLLGVAQKKIRDLRLEGKGTSVSDRSSISDMNLKDREGM